MRFAPRLKELRRKARLQELVVLVWGPGEPRPGAPDVLQNYWAKRVQIRETLTGLFPNSDILFSESDALRDQTRDLDDLLAEELAHAAIADCILVLDVSRGAHVEVDRFSAIPAIASKMTVLLPEKYVGNDGLVSQVHQAIRVVGFSGEELAACHVATVKSVRVVDTAALRVMMLATVTPYL